MFSIKINLDFDSREQAKRFFKSIKPELDEEFLRSKTTVAQNAEKLEIELFASDKTALRASLNSLLKPIMLFEEIELMEN